MKYDAHLFPGKGRQGVLNLVVLGVFRANIIVDAGSFLELIAISIMSASTHQLGQAYLLE